MHLARGHARTFLLRLEAGQFVHLSIIPDGIAITVDCLHPNSRTFRKITSPYTSDGPLSVYLVGPRAGRYGFTLRAVQAGGTSGSATIHTTPITTAGAEDRIRSQAQQQLADGIQFRALGTAEGLSSAAAHYERALDLSRSINEQQLSAETLVAMALALYDQGENSRAREAAAKALPLFQAVGDRRGEAAALDSTGLAEDAMGEEQGALAHYEAALTLRRTLGDRLAEAETLNNIGVAYDSLGEKRRALDYFEQSLALKHALQLPDREGTTLNNIGTVLFALGDMQGALARYRQALPLRTAQGDIHGQSVTLTNIGSAYLTLGDEQTALEYFRRAQRLANRVGNNVWQGTLANNLGLVMFQRGDIQTAISHYRQSIEFRLAAADKTGEAVTRNNLARAFGRLGDVAQEQDHFDRALRLIQDVGDKRWEANILNNLGNAHISRGESEPAAKYFADALRLAQSIGDLRAESVARFGSARVAASRGDFDAARTAMDQVLPIVESLRARVASLNLRTSYFATLREPYDFYVDLLMRMHERSAVSGFDGEALLVLERARARALLETLGESRTALRAGADPALLKRERSLLERIEGKREAQIRMLGRPHTEREVATLRRDLDELMMQYRETEGEIRSRSPRYASLTQPGALSLTDIQELVDDDTVLIEFFLGQQRSYAWAISRQLMTSFVLPPEGEITTAARRLYGLLTERNRVTPEETPAQYRQRVQRAEARFHAAAADVSQMALGPLTDSLTYKRLAIVSDGALHYIPFNALPLPRQDVRGNRVDRPDGPRGGPLIQNHEVVRLPSASVLTALRRHAPDRSPASKTVAIIADPVYGRDDPRVARGVESGPVSALPTNGTTTAPPQNASSDDAWSRERLLRSGEDAGTGNLAFRRLPFANREARAILQLTAPGTGRAALDFEASRATALSPDLGQYRVLHFATHGVVNNQHPDLSGLVLSLVDRRGRPQNGFLRLEDIYNLEVNAELVVLGACQTAIGKEIKGEGLVALARGFMHAGVPRVVATLWKVDDAATAELMQRFYTGVLQRGQAPAAALREAQLEMFRQRAWSSPFYWAGFEIQGEWR